MKPTQYFIALLLVSNCVAHPRDYVDYYVDWYGIIKPSEDTQVAKAHEIFERLKQVADKNPKFLNPKLRVLKNKGKTHWARALRDGNIVLWKSAIKACFQGATSKDEIEARLAFILGHELGHLAKDDYWHLEVERMLKKNRSLTRERLELAADGEGYAYAALAAYRVDLLLGKRFNKKAFLTHWLKRVKLPKNYPPIKKRVAVLQTYLQDIQKKLTFF
jgi:Zn-dependent protease with chaperone function